MACEAYTMGMAPEVYEFDEPGELVCVGPTRIELYRGPVCWRVIVGCGVGFVHCLRATHEQNGDKRTMYRGVTRLVLVRADAENNCVYMPNGEGGDCVRFRAGDVGIKSFASGNVHVTM